MAVRTRLELATSCVTGRRSNQTELPDQLLPIEAAEKIRSLPSRVQLLDLEEIVERSRPV